MIFSFTCGAEEKPYGIPFVSSVLFNCKKLKMKWTIEAILSSTKAQKTNDVLSHMIFFMFESISTSSQIRKWGKFFVSAGERDSLMCRNSISDMKSVKRKIHQLLFDELWDVINGNKLFDTNHFMLLSFVFIKFSKHLEWFSMLPPEHFPGARNKSCKIRQNSFHFNFILLPLYRFRTIRNCKEVKSQSRAK